MASAPNGAKSSAMSPAEKTSVTHRSARDSREPGSWRVSSRTRPPCWRTLATRPKEPVSSDAIANAPSVVAPKTRASRIAEPSPRTSDVPASMIDQRAPET